MKKTEPSPMTRVSIPLPDRDSGEAVSDLLFLRDWERNRTANLGAMLRVAQIRRANPHLAAAIERETKTSS